MIVINADAIHFKSAISRILVYFMNRIVLAVALILLSRSCATAQDIPVSEVKSKLTESVIYFQNHEASLKKWVCEGTDYSGQQTGKAGYVVERSGNNSLEPISQLALRISRDSA